MDVLCVDKTGTITANHLAVARVIPLPGFSEGDVLRHAAYASEAANQDPIDLAILTAAHDRVTTPSEVTVVSFVPFDATRRRTEAVVQLGRASHARRQRRRRRRGTGLRAGCRGHGGARRACAPGSGSRLPHARRCTRIRSVGAGTGRSPLPVRSPARGRRRPSSRRCAAWA